MEHMSWARLRENSALALLSLLFLASVYRARWISISMDEAYTYLSFVAPPWTRLLTTYSPNNHVLFSLLAKASIEIFGVSEFSLRLPALLGCLLILFAAWGISRTLFERRALMLLCICLVTLNPLTFDYMSQARGYSLALGLYLLGMLRTVSFPLSPSSKWESPEMVLQGILFGLAIAANVSFAIPVLALNFLFGAAIATRMPRLSWHAMKWLLTSEILAFCAVAGSPLLHVDRREFVGGFASVLDALSNFSAACVIHDWDGNGIWTHQVNIWTSEFLYPAFRIVFLIVVGITVCLLAGYLRRRITPGSSLIRDARNEYQLFWFGGSLVLSITMLVIVHWTARVPYPLARMVIYCWPLLAITACLLVERFHGGGAIERLFSTLLLLFFVVMVIQSSLQFDLDHFGWLGYSAGTKQAAGIIREREANSQREITISASGSLYACLDFYRTVFSMKRWRLEVRSAEPKPDDYLLMDVFEVRAGIPPGYRQIWRDSLSGAVLLIPLAGT
jgi:uncharacterized membrane protein